MICLLPNCCFLSETSRMLEIYGALRARGADVRVATHGGTYEWALGAAGVPYDLLGAPMSAERCATFVQSVPGIGAPDQSMWSDDELRAYVQAEVAYFREQDVQVAVTGWTLTALLSTRVAEIPIVTEHAGSFLPPLFERRMLPAPSGPVGLPLERWLPQPVRRWLFNLGAARLMIYTDGFNRIAAELGVDGLPSFPALLLGDLTLVTDVPEVLGIASPELRAWVPRDPGRYRPTPRLRYTGPLYAKLPVPVADRVDRFLAGPRPIVYVAVTSSQATLVRQIVTALRELDVRILVAATVHGLGDLNDEQVLVGEVLPSHEIMPRVDLAVISGGQGSVQTALASGLPFIGVPLQPEQDANVFFAQRQRAARLLTPKAAGSARLAKAAQQMLADPGYRDNARRVQAIFAATDGAGAAADAILGLVGDRLGHAARIRPGQVAPGRP